MPISQNLLASANTWNFPQYYDVILTGTITQLTIGGNADSVEIVGATAAEAGLALAMFNTTAGTAAHIDFYRSKNATIGSATVVASGDNLGSITWYGAQQTGTFATQNPAAQIRAEVDTTVTSGAGADMPGRLIFSTTANAAGAVTDRLILDSTGILKPDTNGGVGLGTAALSFGNLFLLSGAVINFANSDVVWTHSSNLITQTGGNFTISFAHPALTLNADTNSDPQVIFQENAVQKWRIVNDNADDNLKVLDADSSAGVKIAQNATAWVSASDRRLRRKQNARDLSVLDKLDAFRLVEYGEGYQHISIIAQEFYDCFPALVQKGDNTDRVIDRIDVPGVWSAPAEPVGFIALGGVKELLKRVTALEAKIAKLEKSTKGA